MLRIIGPGILVAATGVGAGDLATASFAGSHLGLAILWAVVVGAGLKFLINEGIARWQLVTGETVLEGGARRFGRPIQWAFLAYLIAWSFLVGAALISACGAAGHAIYPVGDARADKILYGTLHSAAAFLFVWLGGYRVFEKMMHACIGVMFVVVVVTAVALRPNPVDVAAGLVIPSVPRASTEGMAWTIALLGGVGGTLTVLCYGYWIREAGRHGPAWLGPCRVDLAVGYAATALFGIAMVVIGSQLVPLEGRGAGLVLMLADHLEEALAPWGRVARAAFLAGAWAAFFSSLLGVWQSVPYLFADTWRLIRNTSYKCSPSGAADQVRPDDVVGDARTSAPAHIGGPAATGTASPVERSVDVRSVPYRAYLGGLATVPCLGLLVEFQRLQKVYAIVGALCIPMLAVALLFLNGSARHIGPNHANSRWTNLLLAATLVFFVIAGVIEILG